VDAADTQVVVVDARVAVDAPREAEAVWAAECHPEAAQGARARVPVVPPGRAWEPVEQGEQAVVPGVQARVPVVRAGRARLPVERRDPGPGVLAGPPVAPAFDRARAPVLLRAWEPRAPAMVPEA
jgi:hypothetical protein